MKKRTVRLVYNLVHGVVPGAPCFTWCTVYHFVHGVALGGRSAALSPGSFNNQKHCNPTIVHSCMHFL